MPGGVWGAAEPARNRAPARFERTSGFRDPFIRDDGGYTSLSVALALLLSLSLLVASTQVYWVESESPDIQFAADAGALAAANVVAEYYVLAKVADATVLSMSLLALTIYGISIVLCCIPTLIPLGLKLITVAQRVENARDTLSRAMRSGLDALQEVLPLLCAANATSVIAQNSGASGSASFIGTAIPVPLTGGSEEIDDGSSTEDETDRIEEHSGEAAEHTSRLEESDRKMSESKERAYQADCGNNPGYCMYQRASTLAGLSGASNPWYSSAESWSFSVALERARAYYRARLAQEAPADGSLDEAVRSACRMRYFEYAVELMASGYVNEGEGFSAYFPLTPANTSEMRATHLYTDRVWPVSTDGVIHGVASCPACAEKGVAGYASLAELESGLCKDCGTCRFLASSLGKAGAPSSSIENGFEYHYRIVAEEAQRYEEESARRAEEEAAVRESTEDSLDAFSDALDELAEARGRYNPEPPGRYGCIAVVVDLDTHASPLPAPDVFSSRSAEIGPRAAVSAAALGADDPEEGHNLISSMLDGIFDDTVDSGGLGWLEAAGSWLLGLWGGALQFYCDGVEAVTNWIEQALNSLPLVGESGIGTWAKESILAILKALGIEPLDLSTPKPVTVNSAYVLEKANSSLSEVLAAARGLLGVGKMPEKLEIEGPFDTTITVYLPESEQEIPEAVYRTFEGVAG